MAKAMEDHHIPRVLVVIWVRDLSTRWRVWNQKEVKLKETRNQSQKMMRKRSLVGIVRTTITFIQGSIQRCSKRFILVIMIKLMHWALNRFSAMRKSIKQTSFFQTLSHQDNTRNRLPRKKDHQQTRFKVRSSNSKSQKGKKKTNQSSSTSSRSLAILYRKASQIGIIIVVKRNQSWDKNTILIIKCLENIKNQMKGYQTKTNFSETKMSERQAQVIVSQ